MRLRLAAIYTTYKPDVGFRARIDAVVARCQATIVVDNTPSGHHFEDRSGLEVLQDGVNKGLGRALNLGIARAREMGCNAVILFDQDSSPPAAFIDALLRESEKLGFSKVGVGPRFIDDSETKPGHIMQVDPQAGAVEVSCLATSGMLFPIEDLGADDIFSEAFFLDFVDFDWCWRMRTKGWRLFRLDHVPMPHRLGLAQRRVLGKAYHVPAPYRHYFQFRDTLYLLGMKTVPLYSKLRFGGLLLPKLLVYPFILDRGTERLSWMLKGISDYLKSVRGVGAAGRKIL
jgi:rhamnosyltransferase